MELFTIQCTTCRVRLKVKDESAIGDILACPKCGSMVQVVPPVDWKRSGDTPAAAAVPISVTPSQVAPPATPNSSAAPPALAVAAVVPPALPQRSVAPPPVSAAVAAPQAAESPTPIATESMPAEAAVASSDANSWSRALLARLQADWPLLTGGLGAGALLGTAVWLVVARGGPEPQIVGPSSPPATVAAQPSPAERPSVVDQAAEPSTALVAAEPLAPTAAVAGRSSQATPQPIEPPTDDASATENSAPAVEDKPAVAQAAPAAAAAPVDKPKPAIKLDPVARPPVAKDPLDLAAVPPSAADEPPSTGDARDAPSGVSGRTQDDDAVDSPPASTLSQAEVDERLSVALPQIKFVKVPLSQFVDFIAGFAALEITIDDRALAALGKKRQTPVSVKLADTTADEALRAAVEPLGLACVLRDGKLVVTAAASRAK